MVHPSRLSRRRCRARKAADRRISLNLGVSSASEWVTGDRGARRALVNHVNCWRRRLRLERADALRRRGDHRGATDAAQQVVDGDQVFAALGKLPVRQRTAIVLRYYGDLSVDATADAMGVTPGTVKASVSRAMMTLRAVLAEEVRR